MGSEADETGNIRTEIRHLELMIQQIDHLYDAFFRGLEARPPIQKREELKRGMQKCGKALKTGVQDRFLFQTLQSKYVQFEEKWEKALRQRER